MESIQRCEDGASGSVFQKNQSASQNLALPDLCSNSSFLEINDETLPYMSAIFDDTIDPSIMSDLTGAPSDVPDRSHLKPLTKNQAAMISGLRSQTKSAYSSWLCAPVENSHSINFSMSITSPDTIDITHIIETSPKEGPCDISPHLPPSTSSTEKNEIRVESKNSTFDMTKDLKEKSSGLNSTTSLPCVRAETNVTFEKTQEPKEMSTAGDRSSISTSNVSLETVQEQHLNSTADVCVPSNTTTDQSNENLHHTVDISLSNIPKQEPCNEGTSGEDCETHGTFTKTSEETSVTSTGNVELSRNVSPIESTEAGETSSGKLHPADGTFTKHNTTADVASAGSLSSMKNEDVHVTINMITADKELQGLSAEGGAAVDAFSPEASPQLCINNISVAESAEGAAYSNRTLDMERKEEEHQAILKRRNGVSEQECHLNLDISHSSMFSLDDTLDMKSLALVTSTPVVLVRGFDRLRCAKPMDMQKRLSVINSIESQSNDELAGVSEHDRSGASSIKSESSQTRQDSAKCTSSSSTSESAAVNKPVSKQAVRRKIPQPSCKTNIPKMQIPPRPPTSQATSSLVARSKAVSAPQASSQPETSSSALRGMKRTVQFNKGKNHLPTKNSVTAVTVRNSFDSACTSGSALTTDSKPSQNITQPKPSGLQPPGRGRFGLKPPGAVVFSGETGRSLTNNKPTRLSGFGQKHASSDALLLAKRKRTDIQDQLSTAEAHVSSKPGEGIQRLVSAQKDIKFKKLNTDCGNCTVLKGKLNTFHQELGRFLQELGGMPAACENWSSFQQKVEMYLEEFKRLQADHH